MGMFDSLICHSPLPFPEEMPTALRVFLQATEYQTKDLNCWMDHFELRENGTLWREEYDIEDHSDHTVEGLMRIAGCATKVNKRWKAAVDVFARITFYTSIGAEYTGGIDFIAYIVDGRLYRPIELAEYRPEDPVEEVARAEYRKEWMKRLLEENEGAATNPLP